jgi:hypothetical protein
MQTIYPSYNTDDLEAALAEQIKLLADIIVNILLEEPE